MHLIFIMYYIFIDFDVTFCFPNKKEQLAISESTNSSELKIMRLGVQYLKNNVSALRKQAHQNSCSTYVNQCNLSKDGLTVQYILCLK